MRIQVTRSGGVAGIRRSAAVEFDLRTSRDGYDPEWAALYRAARSEERRLATGNEEAEGGSEAGAGQGSAVSAGRTRDAFQWTLRLGTKRLEVPDGALQGALRELAEKVLAAGEGDRGEGDRGEGDRGEGDRGEGNPGEWNRGASA
ncbi:hypothetical protein [Sinomonas halotolerans]|uniref:Uncharacterized protein n=1 Tax=Sinomonas halotolerans TaxID=1644133 RepID=A0ABU9WX51_9MICC